MPIIRLWFIFNLNIHMKHPVNRCYFVLEEFIFNDTEYCLEEKKL